jgi:hypothetical protein
MTKEDKVLVGDFFTGESDEDGKIFLRRKKIGQIFVYNAKTGDKINPIDIDLEEGVITIEQ